MGEEIETQFMGLTDKEVVRRSLEMVDSLMKEFRRFEKENNLKEMQRLLQMAERYLEVAQRFNENPGAQ